jgi:hypothetical protein
MVRQPAALARWKSLEADRADSDPVERHDLVPQFGEHAPDLALLAFGQNQLE